LFFLEKEVTTIAETTAAMCGEKEMKESGTTLEKRPFCSEEDPRAHVDQKKTKSQNDIFSAGGSLGTINPACSGIPAQKLTTGEGRGRRPGTSSHCVQTAQN
jgi:hypothetical protein